MTISTEVRKAGPFIGNGSASVFPFAFKVFKAADLTVVRRQDNIGEETTLVLDSDYHVTLNGNQDTTPGGVVTLAAGALASGFTLVASSELPYLQPTDLTNQGGFYPKVITNALDRLTIFCQQLAEITGRTLKLPITAPTNISAEIPLPNPSELIAWDETGTKLTTVSPQSLVTSIAYGSATADLFAGDGVTTTFPLTTNPASVNNLDVSIGGHSQRPVQGGVGDYSWNGGASITFVTPPPAPTVPGDKNVLVRYMQAIPVSDSEALHAQTREALRRSYAEAGYNLVDGSFETGGTLTAAADVLLQESTGATYAWTGALPKVVAPGFDPLGAAGFELRTDVALRGELASDSGFDLVNFKRTAAANLVSLANVVSEQAVSVSWFGLQAAMNVGSKSVRVYANNGETYSITSKLTIPDGVKVYGDGDVVITVNLAATDEFVQLGVGSELHNITFVAANRTEAASTLGVAQGYLYDLKANGIAMSNDSSCHYVKVVGANKGFVAGEKSNIKLLNCSTLQTGYGAVSFYHCSNVRIFGGDYVQCGGFGGVMLPSCHDFEIIGLKVVNKTGTGINPGGSATAGYNVERGLVTGCIVEAGDCVNFENGCVDVTIQGNICTINSELGTSNGVGVGSLSHSGGGPVSNVLISGNTIRSLTGGEGIKFGCLDVSQYIDRVSITDNTVRGTKIGCYALTGAKSRDCRIAANTFGADTGGIWLSGPHKRLNVSDNSVTTSSGVTLSNYYGVYILGALEDSYIGRNTTTGWGTHYRQEAICTNTELHIDLVNANEVDLAGYETFSSSVTPSLRPMAELKSYWMRGVNSSFTFTPRAKSGLIMLDANVSYTPASNQSVSLWMYMSTRNGASTGYTDAGISLIKISGLKHDFGSAITDCALVGSNDDNTISISAGGFNVFSIREIEGNI